MTNTKTLNQIQFERFALPDARTTVSVEAEKIIGSDYIDLAALKKNETAKLPLGSPLALHADIKFLKDAGLSHAALVRFNSHSGRHGVEHVLVPVEAHHALTKVLEARTAKKSAATIKVA